MILKLLGVLLVALMLFVLAVMFGCWYCHKRNREYYPVPRKIEKDRGQ